MLNLPVFIVQYTTSSTSNHLVVYRLAHLYAPRHPCRLYIARRVGLGLALCLLRSGICFWRFK
jgi:hypothetical protein